MRNSWVLQTILQLVIIGISWGIAISRPDLGMLGIGGIANQAFPPMLGLATLIIYGLVSIVQKRGNFNVCLFMVAVNLAFGVYLYFHK